MNIFLYGSNTTTGEAIKNNFNKNYLNCEFYSFSTTSNGNFVDFNNWETFYQINSEEKLLIINLGPIWLFSKFIENIFNNKPDLLKNLIGIISTSSSLALLLRLRPQTRHRILLYLRQCPQFCF